MVIKARAHPISNIQECHLKPVMYELGLQTTGADPTKEINRFRSYHKRLKNEEVKKRIGQRVVHLI